MGLFINNDKHPDVFKNQMEIKASNQGFYKQDYLSEMIEEQRRANESLEKSLQELDDMHKKQSQIQSNEMMNIRYSLEVLEDQQIKQEAIEGGVIESLERYEGKNEELVMKMDQQVALQQQITAQIDEQEKNQHEIVNRLENQEALSEKMLRQIDNFRSILYERTNYLAEKIEKGYNSTSSYIYKMMTTNKGPDIQEEIKQESIDK